MQKSMYQYSSLTPSIHFKEKDMFFAVIRHF